MLSWKFGRQPCWGCSLPHLVIMTFDVSPAQAMAPKGHRPQGGHCILRAAAVMASIMKTCLAAWVTSLGLYIAPSCLSALGGH